MDDLLQQGIAAYRAGKRDEARKIFIILVEQAPDNEHAWEWMYNVCNTDKGRIHCLKQILRINPQNEKANQLLAKQPSSPQLTPTTKTKSTDEIQKPHDPQNQKNLLIGIVSTIILCFVCICLVVFNNSGGGGGNPTPTSPAFISSTQQPPALLPTQQPSCNSSYPTVCINNNPHLNCEELRARGIQKFQVLSPDPLDYDRDGDGIGCE